MYLSKSIGSPLFAHTNASEDWLVLTGEEIPYFGGLMQEVFFSWLSLKFSCTNLVWLVRKYWICRKNCNRIVIWNLLMKLHVRLQCSEFIKWYSSCTGTKSRTGTKVCICMCVCVHAYHHFTPLLQNLDNVMNGIKDSSMGVGSRSRSSILHHLYQTNTEILQKL